MPEGRQLKILIADSDQYARELIKKWVTRVANLEILEAQSGFDAIFITRTEMPNVVILDVLLDGIDGYQVCKHLKENPQTKDIPIILLSVEGQEPNVRAKALSFGASDYIAKPFYGPELLAQVRTVLVSEEIKLLAELLCS
ncbi:TPA: response regulator [Candidatus Poribacteria bacterium]|nr:response regulator [Candidatus Poribacteria bacterium]